VRPPPARAQRAKAAPAAKRVGRQLVTTLARQLQSFATSMLGNMGTATDEAFTLAQSRIHRPGSKAAVAMGAALLRELRQAASLTLDDPGRSLEVDELSFMGLVDTGKVGLPFADIYRSHDAVRALADADFAATLSFADAAFATALAFQAQRPTRSQRSAGPAQGALSRATSRGPCRG